MEIGEGFNQFLRVQRERAEAGVLLFAVMKSRKQNTELPLNASDQDKSPLRHHKKVGWGFYPNDNKFVGLKAQPTRFKP